MVLESLPRRQLAGLKGDMWAAPTELASLIISIEESYPHRWETRLSQISYRRQQHRVSGGNGREDGAARPCSPPSEATRRHFRRSHRAQQWRASPRPRGGAADPASPSGGKVEHLWPASDLPGQLCSGWTQYSNARGTQSLTHMEHREWTGSICQRWRSPPTAAEGWPSTELPARRGLTPLTQAELNPHCPCTSGSHPPYAH